MGRDKSKRFLTLAGRDFRLTDVGGRVLHDWLA